MNKLLIIVALVLVGIVIGGDIGPAMIGFIIIGLMFYGMYKFIKAIILSFFEASNNGITNANKKDITKAVGKSSFEFIRRAVPYLFKWH